MKKALDESVSEAKVEAARLGEALAKVRTEYGEQDWAHAKDAERTKAGFERALATVLADRENLQRELKHSKRDGRRADVERARVADEAAAVVEKAVAQREWALEVLDRAVDAEEEFARHLHYELYRASLLAMPETARVDDAEIDGAQTLHEVCARARTEWQREVVELRGDLAGLRRDVAAAGIAIDASSTCGIARGWAAAVDTVEHAVRRTARVWAAMQRAGRRSRRRRRRRRRAKRGKAAAGLREYLRGYDEGTFDPSKYAMDARARRRGDAEPPPPPPPRREERDETPAGMRRKQTIDRRFRSRRLSPAGTRGEGRVPGGDLARTGEAEGDGEEAERRAREAESAAAAASDKVAVGAPAAPPARGRRGAGSTTTTPAAADSTNARRRPEALLREESPEDARVDRGDAGSRDGKDGEDGGASAFQSSPTRRPSQPPRRSRRSRATYGFDDNSCESIPC